MLFSFILCNDTSCSSRTRGLISRKLEVWKIHRNGLNLMSVSLFSGFQTQTPRVSSHTKTALDFWLGRKTVQGAIEEALLKLRPRNEPILVGSSRYICLFHHSNIICRRWCLVTRTDTGVHALETTATVDLKRRVNNTNESEYYRPKQGNHHPDFTVDRIHY